VESHFIGDVSAEERGVYERQLGEALEKQGKAPYTIIRGGTSGMGALGFAGVLAEIHTQCRENNFDISTIFAPAGNGGGASGLIYGNALLGRPFRLCIISVEDPVPELTLNIRRTIAETEAVTGLPFPGALDESCEIIDDYRGGGWSVNTPESEAAVLSFPALEGIFIENVYTSKVVVAMEDYIRKGKVSGGLCYIHTGGFGSLFSQFDPANPPQAAGR
jgi:1-aminocyclopropane-1-carboxylate deaminase/D-cysteine desulfhydrase-like pyridoxal-dependent ACC family enzyme